MIFLLLILLAGAIIFATSQTFLGSSTTHFISAPAVQTYVMSENGGAHMFGAQVVLELDNNAPDIDQDLLYSAISAAASSFSYEEITSFYGMEMLREAVHVRLLHNIDEEYLLGVYFFQFVNDMPLLILQEERTPSRNPFVDALLGN